MILPLVWFVFFFKYYLIGAMGYVNLSEGNVKLRPRDKPLTNCSLIQLIVCRSSKNPSIVRVLDVGETLCSYDTPKLLNTQ